MEPFSDETAPIVVPAFALPVRSCPSCGGAPLVSVRDCDAVHLLCGECRRCWRTVHGALRAVDPLTCPGCGSQPKAQCIAQMSAHFPQFGPAPTEPGT